MLLIKIKQIKKNLIVAFAYLDHISNQHPQKHSHTEQVEIQMP